MNKLIKKQFAGMQKGAVVTLCMVCVLFLTSTGCGKQSNNANDETEKFCSYIYEENIDKTIPLVNDFLSGLSIEVNEEQQLQELIEWLKSCSCIIDVTFLYQSFEYEDAPPMSVLSVSFEENEENKESFLYLSMASPIKALGYNLFNYSNLGFEWAVELKLKPQADESYLATEDTEIKALITKYDVELSQHLGTVRHPEIFWWYYNLSGTGNNKENAIKDFLATGKFENYVREYDISYTCNE